MSSPEATNVLRRWECVILRKSVMLDQGSDREASDVLQFSAHLIVGVVKIQGVWAWESAVRALWNLCP